MRHAAKLIDLRDIPAAIGLLTRLPIRFSSDYPQNRGAAAAWAYPLVGVATGGISLGLAIIAMALELSAGIAAGLALGTGIFITGGLHQDGLADTADGLWGGWTAERRLEIMKDSQIGSYGVAALIIVLGLTWQAIALLLTTPTGALAILACAIASRGAMVLIMRALPHARPNGLSASVGHPSRSTTAIAAALGLAALAVSLGLIGILAGVIGVVMAIAVALTAQAKIHGQTGDILGATQQLSELSMLLTCTALCT